MKEAPARRYEGLANVNESNGAHHPECSVLNAAGDGQREGGEEGPRPEPAVVRSAPVGGSSGSGSSTQHSGALDGREGLEETNGLELHILPHLDGEEEGGGHGGVEEGVEEDSARDHLHGVLHDHQHACNEAGGSRGTTQLSDGEECNDGQPRTAESLPETHVVVAAVLVGHANVAVGHVRVEASEPHNECQDELAKRRVDVEEVRPSGVPLGHGDEVHFIEEHHARRSDVVEPRRQRKGGDHGQADDVPSRPRLGRPLVEGEEPALRVRHCDVDDRRALPPALSCCRRAHSQWAAVSAPDTVVERARRPLPNNRTLAPVQLPPP
mmetsp:Transcript_7301/g.31032  ORF Transcript_7301/g.31032 Transcript_7301/m.31032 type:complete len:325 (+) Transcript_7301:950-1924(+)